MLNKKSLTDQLEVQQKYLIRNRHVIKLTREKWKRQQFDYVDERQYYFKRYTIYVIYVSKAQIFFLFLKNLIKKIFCYDLASLKRKKIYKNSLFLNQSVKN